MKGTFCLPELRVAYWNVNGNLARKLVEDGVLKAVQGFDVVFFGETWLKEVEVGAVQAPPGFFFVACCRKLASELEPASGGVAVMYRATLDARVVDSISNQDVIVLELRDLVLLGAYVCPTTTDWGRWSTVDPESCVMEAVAFASAMDPARRIVVLGDMNGRTGSRNASLPRTSRDEKVNTRGLWLLDLCAAFRLDILNGTRVEGSSRPGGFTSFQGAGQAVVDYVLFSTAACHQLADASLVVTRPGGWSDHALIGLKVSIPAPKRSAAQSEERGVHRSVVQVEAVMRAERPAWLRKDEEIERLLVKTLKSSVCADSATLALYGATYADAKAVDIYVESYSKRRGTGNSPVVTVAVVSYGCREDSRWMGGRLPGGVPGGETNGLLYVVSLAMRQISAYRRIRVYSSSKAFVQLVSVGLGEVAACGCGGSAGSMFAESMRGRAAPLDVRLGTRDSHASHLRVIRFRSRDLWRRSALTLPELDVGFPWPTFHAQQPRLAVPKLVISLADKKKLVSWGSRAAKPYFTVAPADPLASVRTRKAVRRAQARVLERMLKGGQEFWTVMRECTAEKDRPSLVDADQLAHVFEARLNPPPVPPAHFDEPQRLYYDSLARAMPSVTADRSAEQFFTAAFAPPELAAVRVLLRKKGPKSARGADRVSYELILSLSNESLANLFNTCIQRMTAPEGWMTTVLVGLLKPGKASADPDGYRLIGLESCLLKVLTLLIEKRIRSWAEARKFFPDSQNGFRAGLRTHNNSFVLRTAIDRARASGKTLFVAFVDLKNAFPATDIPTLWVKLYAAGVAGPLFDWLRMVYARMKYVVRHGGEVTEAFKSLIGLLTGDTASPVLWNVFFADLDAAIAQDGDDLCLAGRPISHVEQADDVALWSTTQAGLQRKLDAFFAWCRSNFMTISVSKPEWMMFGPIPTAKRIKPLVVDGNQVALVPKYKYVGVVFTSTKADIFFEHYVMKAVKGMRVASVIFSLESHVGVLTVATGCSLYKACVDPHLTFASEVVVDVHAAGIRRLEKVQIYFLRRLMGLTRRSTTMTLYTETGLMPLRYRRIILALRYLQYTINLPANVFASSGVRDSMRLHHERVRGWVMDLEYVLGRLPVSVAVPSWDERAMKENDWFLDVIDRVYRACDAWIEETVLSSPRLWMLHQRFREIRAKVDKKREPGRLYFAKRQPWTGVINPDHRRALARLVASNHRLGVEVLRRGDGQRRRPVPREWRLCRFCRAEVEDEVHALLVCGATDGLVVLRAQFWSDLDRRDVGWKRVREISPGFFVLHALLSTEATCARLGRYVAEVFSLFDEVAVFVPARELYEEDDDMVTERANGDGEESDRGDDDSGDEHSDGDDYMALALRGFG